MANWQGMILTTKGRALQAKVEAGTTLLHLTKIKLGDGVISGSQTLEGLTDLVSPKQIIGITTIDPQSTGICKITGTVTNVGLETGYNIKELGLFATDPDAGEILYAITTDSNFDYLQAEGGATIVSEEFNLSISISNTSQVTAIIDAAGLLTVKTANTLIAAHDTKADSHAPAFAAHNADTGAHPDIHAALKKAGGVPIGTITARLSKKPEAGELALDTGALVSRATYPDLWAWVQANAPLLSETDWQTQAAAQTSVGAYSTGDGSTTFRLPRLLDYFRGGAVADVGKWQGDAIRNITGYAAPFSDYPSGSTGNVVGGAFSAVGNGYIGNASVGPNDNARLDFDASRVVPTADENRPKTIKVLYCVKAFDAETNQGLIDITALANEMAGKVDKTTYAADFAKNISGNGYQKLPTGLIIQWAYGSFSTANDALQTITLPITFPNGILTAVVGTEANSAVIDDTWYTCHSKTNSTITVQRGSTNTGGYNVKPSVIAIGY
ncbi:MAG: gp53-like domain-containing protein [Selenomonadaceae bacterium]